MCASSQRVCSVLSAQPTDVLLVLCPGRMMTQACKPLTLRQENAIPGLQEFLLLLLGLIWFAFFFFNIVFICGRKTQAGPEN